MRRFALLLSTTLAACALTIAAACGPADTGPPPPIFRDPDPGGPKDAGFSDAGTTDPGFDGGGTATAGRIFAHTSNTLFLFEPVKRTLTKIGKFSCLDAGDSVIDIAIDRTGAMFGTTFYDFISIDPISGACTVVKSGSYKDYPNSLSFVPAGTVDPTKEALVGYQFDGVDATKYVRIDTTTGATSVIGNLNPPNTATPYESSGDFVSLIQDANKTYLSVKYINVPDGGAPTDFLAEVDPKTGAMKRIIGDTKHENLYGLGYWAGKAYGFASDGRVLEINVANGAATVVGALPPGESALGWYGAGVTTQAPARL